MSQLLSCDDLVKDLNLTKGQCCAACISNKDGEDLTDLEIQGKIYLVCCNHLREWSERNLCMTKVKS